MLEQHQMFKPGCLADLPKLAAYYQRFKDEPKIKKFMESPKYFEGPCNNKMASWGGSFPVAPIALWDSQIGQDWQTDNECVRI